MANQTIRVSLKAYDHILLDKSTEKIVKTAKSTGAIISGPYLYLQKVYIHHFKISSVNKKSREQFPKKFIKRVYRYIEFNTQNGRIFNEIRFTCWVDIEIKV
ncbi:MAG: 30S ribosomal protein S10 [Candidatus Neomarinimicrobiota bacterium]|nr:MAG: 30S ribosomal protein S10 [Candidatus Neomarinimicrobiota bacterium]